MTRKRTQWKLYSFCGFFFANRLEKGMILSNKTNCKYKICKLCAYLECFEIINVKINQLFFSKGHFLRRNDEVIISKENEFEFPAIASDQQQHSNTFILICQFYMHWALGLLHFYMIGQCKILFPIHQKVQKGTI